ncbi:cation:proton antiporter [Oricola sp.]|uniref:cation:proton antiporter domain-containing protein n=1 Tax=Oricola sp. TaxID=1979950 RepID=UPI0025CF0263|nr:cation:proton antiporter [Oricola sp.]MCI5075467.1 cation:proton antiporter [Oricola sp.]
MEHGEGAIFLEDALVFLFAAGIIVPLFRRLHLPIIVGFVIAGAALGPNGFGALAHDWPVLSHFTITDPDAADQFAELGVLFLLFMLGLEFSFEKLWGLRHLVFGGGSLQVGVSAVLLSLLAYVAGASAVGAVTAGLALALSSTAIVSQLLIDQHRIAAPVGRTTIGILLFQDLLVAPILIFVGFAGGGEGGSITTVILTALLQGVVAILTIYLIGRYLLRRIFHGAASAGGRDLLMALTLLTVIGAAAITAGAGLSLALGAFLAGLLVGETEFKHQIEVDLEPFKGLFLGLFFMTVGMDLNPSIILANLPMVVAGIVLLIAVKAAAAALAIRLVTGDMSKALDAAGLLAPAGEFAFVVLGVATTTGVIDPGNGVVIAAIAGLSMVLTPLTGRLGTRLAEKRAKPPADAPTVSDYSDLEGHVIVAGFGRVGHAIARILETEDVDLVALDSHAGLVSERRRDGRKVYYGDAARSEILERAGAKGAAMLVVTVDNRTSASAMVRGFRKLCPATPIFARARDKAHAQELLQAGADFVIPEAVEAGLQLAGRALEQFGYDGDSVRTRLALERDSEYMRATDG